MMTGFRPLLPTDPPLAFLDCAPVGSGECIVISAIWGLDDDHDRPTRLLHIMGSEVAYLDLPENIVSICRAGDEVLALSKSGFVYTVMPFLGERHRIGRPEGGTLLRLRDCSGTQFACGMNGQVIRGKKGVWEEYDDALYSPQRSVLSAQLRDIGGRIGQSLVVVGAFGDIFERREVWVHQDVPVNASLEQVLSDIHGNIWIAGQGGTLILRDNEEWRVLDSGANCWFWGMAQFKDSIYLSSLEGLWTLDSTTGLVSSLDHGLDLPLTTYRLQSSDTDLWSIGPNDVARFDGRHWYRIQIPSNA